MAAEFSPDRAPTPHAQEAALRWRKSYFVGIDLPLPGGKVHVDYPLSRRMTSEAICRRVFKRLRRREPGCFVVCVMAVESA